MILGIDPGLDGALAFYEPNVTLRVFDMPVVEVMRGKSKKRELSPQALAALLTASDLMVTHAFVEKVNATPQMGVTSAFSFGLSMGMILGALAARGVPTTLVPPQVWQKAVQQRPGKDGSRQRAMELFPAYTEMFARVKDNGRSDASLIAWYGARHALPQL